jgi:hypothetical protein
MLEKENLELRMECKTALDDTRPLKRHKVISSHKSPLLSELPSPSPPPPPLTMPVAPVSEATSNLIPHPA